MTLNSVMTVILRYYSEVLHFKANCFRATPSAKKTVAQNLISGTIWFMATFIEITENKCVKEKHPGQKQ